MERGIVGRGQELLLGVVDAGLQGGVDPGPGGVHGLSAPAGEALFHHVAAANADPEARKVRKALDGSLAAGKYPEALRADAEALEAVLTQDLSQRRTAVSVHGGLRLLPGGEEEGQARCVQPGVHLRKLRGRCPDDVGVPGPQGVHGAFICPVPQLPEGRALCPDGTVGLFKKEL